MNTTKVLAIALLMAGSPLIATSTDINEIGRDSCTHLMRAAFRGELSRVEALLAEGADADITNEHGNTALMIAINEGKIAVAQKLITWGADTSIVNHAEENARKIALNNRLPSIVELIEKTRIGLTSEKPERWSGTRAVIEAAMSKKAGLATFEELLAADKERLAAKDRAAEEAKVEAARRRVRLNDALSKAMFKEILSSEHIATLLDEGAEPNIRLQRRLTPLMKAAALNFGSKTANTIMQKLIEKGANVNLTDIDGYTALTYTVICHNKDGIEMLLSHGAHVNIPDKNGDTPLMKAVAGYNICRRGKEPVRKDLVEILLKAGGNVRKTNRKEKSALTIANKSGDEELIALVQRYDR